MASNFADGQRVNDPDMIDRALQLPRLDPVIQIGLAVRQARREPADQRAPRPRTPCRSCGARSADVQSPGSPALR